MSMKNRTGLLYVLSRAWSFFYANLMGYFWLSCPICGKNFGGHEPDSGSLITSIDGGMMTCRWCAKEAERHNEIWKGLKVIESQLRKHLNGN